MSARLIGRTGATAGQDFTLMDVASIGASSENEIRIAAPGVSRRHARVVKDKDRYFLEDAGATNGTFLNGGRVTREQLQHLDVITLGRSVDLIFLQTEGDTRPPAVDAITGARLQVMDGAEAGTAFDVPKGELTVGRAASCNVVLASGLISKVHARVQRTANQVVLQDLQSINGTFVNGARVDSVVVLKDGDTINIAGVRTMKVSIDGSGAMKAATPAAIAADEPAFNQEWKTRFVWAPDELALIEQARAEAMQLAALRAPAAAPAAGEKKAAPAAARPAAAAAKAEAPPAAPKPAVAAKAGDVAAAPAAPKPSPPAAPKAAGAQPPPNPAGPPKAAPPVVAAKAEPGVPPVPVKADEVKPAPAPRAPIAPKPDQIAPAGPAQAAVQAAEAPIKPGSPIPVKPDAASSAKPATPTPATPAEAAAKAAPAASPKPADAARPAAAPAAPRPAAAKPEDVTQPLKPADVDVTVPMGMKAPKLRGIRLTGGAIPIALGVGSFVVGRAPGSDVRLDDRQVSRSHARITVDESSAAIEDLQTVNGTLVNGKEVKTRQALNAGDTVQFGASEFRVEFVS